MPCAYWTNLCYDLRMLQLARCQFSSNMSLKNELSCLHEYTDRSMFEWTLSSLTTWTYSKMTLPGFIKLILATTESKSRQIIGMSWRICACILMQSWPKLLAHQLLNSLKRKYFGDVFIQSSIWSCMLNAMQYKVLLTNIKHVELSNWESLYGFKSIIMHRS